MSLHRQLFFDNQVHTKIWKDNMAGKNEEAVIKLLDSLNFQEGSDYQRQYPFANTFVADFAFINEQLVIEVDGESHKRVRQQKKDARRDRFFRENGWAVLRIEDTKLFGEKLSFYKALIKQIVTERREEYNKGNIFSYEHITFEHE